MFLSVHEKKTHIIEGTWKMAGHSSLETPQWDQNISCLVSEAFHVGFFCNLFVILPLLHPLAVLHSHLPRPKMQRGFQFLFCFPRLLVCCDSLQSPPSLDLAWEARAHIERLP